MKTKAITTIMIMLFLLTVPLASSIATVKADEYNRIVFQSIAKGSGRINFYSYSISGSTWYIQPFNEGTVSIDGTSEIESAGFWYSLTPGTVKVRGSILVEWAHGGSEYKLHLIPRDTGFSVPGYVLLDEEGVTWLRINGVRFKCTYMINGEVQEVNYAWMYMSITLLPRLGQISISFDIYQTGAGTTSITLDWFSQSAIIPPGYSAADVFMIGTKLI